MSSKYEAPAYLTQRPKYGAKKCKKFCVFIVVVTLVSMLGVAVYLHLRSEADSQEIPKDLDILGDPEDPIIPDEFDPSTEEYKNAEDDSNTLRMKGARSNPLLQFYEDLAPSTQPTLSANADTPADDDQEGTEIDDTADTNTQPAQPTGNTGAQGPQSTNSIIEAGTEFGGQGFNFSQRSGEEGYEFVD